MESLTQDQSWRFEGRIGADDVSRVVRGTAAAGSALSIIRLGNGEGEVLAYGHSGMSESLARCLLTWFGDRRLSSNELIALAAMTESAVR